ncbi:hypothetical protein JJD41_10505 [Oxynema sp. CENA135]|jgi:hypothetical protein|nr:hypothetical protein [Oxynema sp. CENA135]
MISPEKEAEIQQRIDDEIIVDAYNDEEVMMSWYCYLQDNISFPFEAEWTSSRSSSANKRT